jgi:hypothetical protein
MNEKRKWITAGRLRRGAAILGAVGLVAGAGLATAGSALAVGTNPGGLVLSPATGPLTTQATWAANACPAGFQGSADVEEFTLGGTFVSGISLFVTAPVSPITNGAFQGTVGALLATAGLGLSATNPGTAVWAVGCYSAAGGVGSVTYTDFTYVTATASGTYTTSATAPTLTATTTTLTATPANPVGSGATVNLSASVTATGGATPAGTVQFEQNGTDIGAAVAVNTGGTAAPATTTFTAPTTTSTATVALTAVFTPTATQTYAGSTGSYTLNVVNSSVQTAGAIPVDVTVPATGTLTVTVSTTAITLAVNATPPLVGTGTLNTVSVSDTRNTVPGWSVSGQDTAFTGPTGSTPIPGDDMGWAPTCPTLATGAICGSTVAPGTSPGLADAAQVLASAVPGGGTGSSSLSAALPLAIPRSQLAGAYTSTLTITYLATGP